VDKVYCFQARREMPDVGMTAGDCLHIRPGQPDQPMVVTHPVALTPKRFFNAVMAGDLVADTCEGATDPINAMRALCRWPWDIGGELLLQSDDDRPLTLPEAVTMVADAANRVIPAAPTLSKAEQVARNTTAAENIMSILMEAGYRLVGPNPSVVGEDAPSPQLRVS
jgi:hypothetical protein